MMTPSSGISLDPWFENYAERASGLTASEVRALFAVANRPEVVSLAGGMPFVAALPFDNVSRTIQRVIENSGAAALQYGSGQGLPALREHIMAIMALEGIRAGVDDIVVTTGSQQGLDLVTKLFINPGDAVLAESPSYVGAMGVFRSYQARVEHVAMDDEGMIPQALSERIAHLRRQNVPIQVPVSHSQLPQPCGGHALGPAGVLKFSISPRLRAFWCWRTTPTGFCGLTSPLPTPFVRLMMPGSSIWVRSLNFCSRAPGGLGRCPHGIREKLVLASEAAILSPSSFSQMILAEYFPLTTGRVRSTLFEICIASVGTP